MPGKAQEVTKGRESRGDQGTERWGGQVFVTASPGATGSTWAPKKGLGEVVQICTSEENYDGRKMGWVS